MQPDPFFKEVSRYTYRRVSGKCREHAEDISQLTALYAWKHIAKFDPTKSSIANWIRMTADSILNDYLQRTYMDKALIMENLDLELVDTDLDAQPSSSNYARLAACFGNDKKLLDLLLAGYSITECQGELGLSRMAIRHRMNKAKARAQNVTSRNQFPFV